jgi:hypothetical protein
MPNAHHARLSCLSVVQSLFGGTTVLAYVHTSSSAATCLHGKMQASWHSAQTCLLAGLCDVAQMYNIVYGC